MSTIQCINSYILYFVCLSAISTIAFTYILPYFFFDICIGNSECDATRNRTKREKRSTVSQRSTAHEYAMIFMDLLSRYVLNISMASRKQMHECLCTLAK